MKIVHITTVHKPYDIRIFYKQLRSLQTAGYEVCEIACCQEDHVKDGIAIKAIPVPKGRLQRFSSCAFHAVRRALHEQADIYHIHDPELLPWSLILRLFGKKVVFDMHENISKSVLNKHWIPRYLRKPLSSLVRVAESCLLWRVPVIFAENSYLQSFPNLKSYQIVLNYPRYEMFEGLEVEKNKQNTLVYLGGISKERGITNIIRATNRLRAAGEDYQFKCIGPVPEKLKNYFNELIEPQSVGHIHFLGQLAPEEAYKIVASSHIGFSILLATPNYVGSFATKILEYMGMGLPVIAGNFQVNKDVIDKESAGICVDPKDLDGIIAAIKKTMDDPAAYQRMASNGKLAVAKTYNWEHQFKKIELLYQNTLK